MSLFKNLLVKSLNESEAFEGEELDAVEEVPADEDLNLDDDYSLEADEPVEEDIALGAMVKVQDASSFTADELGVDEDDFEDFKIKVEAGEYAIVFDIDDDSPELVDIVFEDGLEIFKIPKLMLALVDDEEEEDVQPVEDEEVVEEEPLESDEEI